MSSSVRDRLARFVRDFRFDDLPAEVVHETKRLVLDTLGCAVGAVPSLPSRIVCEFARTLGGSASSSVIGYPWKTTPALATLVNGTMIRYLDSNDYFFGSDSGHASSNIPPALALAQHLRSPGTDVVNAIVLGYELHMRLCDAVPPPGISGRGWHTATHVQFSAAAVAGRLLSDDVEVIANALAIAGSHCNTLAEAQRGDIPLMKATAEAYVAKGALESALLAAAGLTGPAEIFEGSAGWSKVVAGTIDYDALVAPLSGRFRIMRSCTKPYPAVAGAMAPIQAAIDLRNDGVSADEVEHLSVALPKVVAKKASGDPRKLAPRDKETADHSIHYCVAVALLDGACGHDQFTPERIRAADVAALMPRIRIEEDDALTRMYPESSGCVLRARMRDGRTAERTLRSPPGHFRNRVGDADMERKFLDLSQGVLSRSDAHQTMEAVWKLEKLDSVDALFSRLIATDGQ